MTETPGIQSLEQCVKCGTCRHVCPVFAVTNGEGGAARGKLGILQYLYRDGERFSRETVKLLKQCVMCGSCQHACPRNVPILEILASAREKALAEGGESGLKRLGLKMIADNRNWAFAAGLADLVPESSGLTLKLPFMNRHWPKPDTVGLQHPGGYFEATGEKRFDVLYFPGCSTRYLYSGTGRKLVHILNRIGIGVRMDEQQVCCGFPHESAGDRTTADRLAAENRSVISSYTDRIQYLVTGCATCGSRLKQLYTEQFANLRILDINELLVAEMDALQSAGLVQLEEKVPVIYHDPCHLAKHQGVRQQPRELLSLFADVVGLDQAVSCCGFGGSFSVFESDLSRQIGDMKASQIEQTGRDVRTNEPTVVTSCPGCVIQITDALRRNGMQNPVVHIVELLYRALEDTDGKN